MIFRFSFLFTARPFVTDIVDWTDEIVSLEHVWFLFFCLLSHLFNYDLDSCPSQTYLSWSEIIPLRLILSMIKNE